MPLPDRLQPAKVNRQKLQQLADMAEEILSQIDNGAKEEDAGLKMLIDSWNSQVINPYAFSDFRDFSSWTSAKDFTRMAFNQEKYVADLTWDELIQIIQFVCQAEGKESEQSYALGVLEKNFDANPSDLIYWQNHRSPGFISGAATLSPCRRLGLNCRWCVPHHGLGQLRPASGYHWSFCRG